jgi:hypothetical protein
MSNEDITSGEQPAVPELPCLAIVVSHGDTNYMGKLRVELLRNVGNNNETQPGQIIEVSMMTPFYGVSGAIADKDKSGDPDDYENTQKSYGMWMIPPDPGSYVMVIFHNGRIERGYWIGCVPNDRGRNFMTPGLAATTYNNDDSSKRLPVAEYNVNAETATGEETKVPKPRHPLADVLESQGLLEDDIRGITTSSARREAPSMVFGISTPGPFDKQPGSKRGEVGEAPNKHTKPISHLGGTTFVMDDGDDKYLRKTNASEGPPEYAHIGAGEEGGDVTLPHNELFRIRTRTGHQILMHNTEDLIYISNARGTSWIELSSDGKIDIYAQDSISIHTDNDFNFHAGRDINIEAGRNINIKTATRLQVESGENTNIIVGADGKITTTGKFDINTGDTNKFTSGGDTHILAANTAIDGGDINFNSGIATAAESAEVLSTFENPTETDGTTITSIMLRVPTTEPYPHHENLNPVDFKTDKTDREAGTVIDVPTAWKEYSTVTDTFEKIQPTEENPEEDQ